MALEIIGSCQLAVEGIDKNSVRVAMRRGPEFGELKNFHCVKSIVRI
jgi:hypothetical protein